MTARAPQFDHMQVREHSMEILQALTTLANAPIFDAEAIEAIGGIDPMTQDALIMANTAILNSTQPYLPYADSDLATTL